VHRGEGGKRILSLWSSVLSVVEIFLRLSLYPKPNLVSKFVQEPLLPVLHKVLHILFVFQVELII
jgi:hypothetical protein